jgi:branched-chain amino acid transport system ATP-binding protein
MDKGRILFCGDDISKLAPEKIVKRGILHVPEGRHVFTHLSVSDNLDLGSYLHYKPSSAQYQRNLAFVYQLFPILQERRKQLAGTLSGGEQQMLAIGRALMADPKLIMLDEPSLGLAPLIIGEVFRILTKLNEEGLPMLLIEQNAKLALEVAKIGYVMERGRIVLHGSTEDLRENNMVVESYLGKQEN